MKRATKASGFTLVEVLVAVAIVVRADMPDQLAYDIVKTIFDKKDELILVHGEAKNFDLKYQRQSASPVPYHPGAANSWETRLAFANA